MRTAFNGSKSDPAAVFYTRCTIDLPSRKQRTEEVPCQNWEDVLGGFGRSFQMLAPRTITQAYSDENPLIINTGLLTASNVMTGLRTYFSAYSPLKVSDKGLPAAMWSTGSGKFGCKFKWTGLDELVLEGRSDEPVLLVIRKGDDGPEVAFEPARDLLGLACHDKIMRLRDRYADAHFAVIGPAGEQFESCYLAAVALSTENQLKSGDDKCRWAGRGGMGGVMGFKNVIGLVAQVPDQLTKLAPDVRDINKEASTGPGSRKLREKNKGGLGGTWSNYEPLETFHFVPQHNFRPQGDGRPELMFRDAVEQEFAIKAESCYRCGINCHKNVYEKKEDGKPGRFLAKFDYEPVNLLSTNLGIDDAGRAAQLISLVDHLGMDNISLGTTIAYVMDYNERHPDALILNGATFGNFEGARDLIQGAADGRYPEVGRGVKRLSEHCGETGYAMHSKGLEYPAYQPDTNPGYPWAIAGGHMSMATYMAVALEGDTSLDYWAKLITERGLYFVRDDLIGICKFAGVSAEGVVRALKTEIGIEITQEELLASVRRAFVHALWLERKQGYERAEYTLPAEVFDRPNRNLTIEPFVTREFFAQLSERVWTVFDREIDAIGR